MGGCNPIANLAAALMMCGMCAPQPPARDLVFIDRVDQSRAKRGQTVLVDVTQPSYRNSKGQYGHVRGFYLGAKARFTVTGAGQNQAVSAYNLRGLFNNFNIQGSDGVQLMSAIDGRTILDDTYFRNYALLQWPNLHSGIQDTGGFPQITQDGGIPANLGVGSGEVDVSLYIPFVRPYDINPMRNLVNLALFQKRSTEAVRFKIAENFVGNVAGAPYADIQFDGLTSLSDGSEGLDVWADIVWLDGIVVDAPQALEEFTDAQRSGTMRRPERKIEYLAIRHFPEDSFGGAFLGQAIVQGYAGISLTVAGMGVIQGFTLSDTVRRGLLFAMTDRDGSLATNNASMDLPLVANQDETKPLALMLLPHRTRDSAASGNINYVYNQRDATQTRYVMRSVGCHTRERAEKIAESLKCNPCQVYGCDPKGQVTAEILSTEPVLIVPQ